MSFSQKQKKSIHHRESKKTLGSQSNPEQNKLITTNNAGGVTILDLKIITEIY